MLIHFNIHQVLTVQAVEVVEPGDASGLERALSVEPSARPQGFTSALMWWGAQRMSWDW